jgi:peroxiredoxin
VTQTDWLWLLFAVTAVNIGAIWLLVFQLLKQNGRVLVRLEAIEARLDPEVDSRPDGLAVGTSFPAFRLPRVDGGSGGVEDYRGRNVLLVHWNFDCGHCDRIASELAAVSEDLRRAGTELVLVSFGDAGHNRALLEEHGLDCDVLLQSEGDVVEEFAPLGTPVAYLLDQAGRVAAPVALGADEVLELARRTAREPTPPPREQALVESDLERTGTGPGSVAPTFTLPALDGGTVSLADYRGRRVLFVFSDPDCGPCDELLPELARVHSRLDPRSAALLMVVRGDPEANRGKCAAYGVDFPVLLQQRWRVSRDYGIFATPVAFLIGPDGLIETQVAQGPDEILVLAAELLGAGKEAPSEISVG